MTKEKTPVLGKPISEEKENLKSIPQEQAQRKLEIMDQLDLIQTPLLVTVIAEPQAFEYRNMAFWKALSKKDQKVREALTDYLNTKGKK